MAKCAHGHVGLFRPPGFAGGKSCSEPIEQARERGARGDSDEDQAPGKYRTEGFRDLPGHDDLWTSVRRGGLVRHPGPGRGSRRRLHRHGRRLSRSPDSRDSRPDRRNRRALAARPPGPFCAGDQVPISDGNRAERRGAVTAAYLPLGGREPAPAADRLHRSLHRPTRPIRPHLWRRRSGPSTTSCARARCGISAVPIIRPGR